MVTLIPLLYSGQPSAPQFPIRYSKTNTPSAHHMHPLFGKLDQTPPHLVEKSIRFFFDTRNEYCPSSSLCQSTIYNLKSKISFVCPALPRHPLSGEHFPGGSEHHGGKNAGSQRDGPCIPDRDFHRVQSHAAPKDEVAPQYGCLQGHQPGSGAGVCVPPQQPRQQPQRQRQRCHQVQEAPAAPKSSIPAEPLRPR